MSPVVQQELCLVCPDDVIAMPSGLSQLGLKDFNIQPASQTGGKGFERCEYLPGRGLNMS